MLGLRRREPEQAKGVGSVYADLSGAVVNGPVAIGEHIVQIHAEHGAVVNCLPPGQRPRPRLREAPLRRLPRDVPGLLGREQVVSEVQTALAAGASPVELTGLAGLGKSALLRHVSHRVEFDSVIFTACRGRPADDLLQFLFESLYECEEVFVPSPAQLAEYLREPRAALLLDDVEYDREELERIVCLTPACAYLYASQSRRLFGEGRSLALEPLEEQAGAALLERELGVELNADERRAAQAFCRRVGEPLRILQAADLVRRGGLTIAELSKSSLEAGLDGSLSESERRVLEPLRALPAAPLDAEQVSALTAVAEAGTVLASLEERGLVQACSPRYVPRPTAAAAPDRQSWAARSVRELALWCERQEEPERVADASEAVLAVLDTRAAPADAFRLARAADPALMYARRWGAWHAVLEHGLAAARQLQDAAGEAWALHQLGSRALPRGEREVAERSLTAALAIREGLGDRAGAAVTRHNLDVLHGGGPPSSSNGRPTGPRRPPLLALLGIAAVVAVIGTTALAGGDKDPKPPPEPAAAGRQSSTDREAAPAGSRSRGGERTPSQDRSARPGTPKVAVPASRCPDGSDRAQEAADDLGVDGCEEPPTTDREEPPITDREEPPITDREEPPTPCCEPRSTPGDAPPATVPPTQSVPRDPPRRCLLLDEDC